MRVVIFCHSVLSDWNNGHAHFVRGIVRELKLRGHKVDVYEPVDAWSAVNLIRDFSEATLYKASQNGTTTSTRYDPAELDLETVLEDAQLVMVHEWNDPALVKAIGDYRAKNGHFRLLFHDTHHRAATAPDQMARYDLSAYDGALVFGEAIRQIYLEQKWANRVWTWHEAADTHRFYPHPKHISGDVVWIGNWGDEERTAELMHYFLEPVRELRLDACIYGVRYPNEAQALLRKRGIKYLGWLPNLQVPTVYAHYHFTVHIPRLPYVEALPGIPTIRVFEALACGMPLISAPWKDSEGLFRPGEDFLMAQGPNQMRDFMRQLIHEPDLAAKLAASGRQRVLERHTCAHRIDELMAIVSELGAPEVVKGAT